EAYGDRLVECGWNEEALRAHEGDTSALEHEPFVKDRPGEVVPVRRSLGIEVPECLEPDADIALGRIHPLHPTVVKIFDAQSTRPAPDRVDPGTNRMSPGPPHARLPSL